MIEVISWVVTLLVILLFLKTMQMFHVERAKRIKVEEDLAQLETTDLSFIEDHEESLEAFDRLLGIETSEDEEEFVLDVECIKDAQKQFIYKWFNALIPSTHQGDVSWETIDPDDFKLEGRFTRRLSGTVKARVKTDSGTFQIVYDRRTRGSWQCFYLCVSRLSDGLVVREEINWDVGEELWDIAKARADKNVTAKDLQQIMASLD